jgi:hypothetical protein
VADTLERPRTRVAADALGEVVARAARAGRSWSDRGVRVVRWLTVGVLGTVAVVPIAGNEQRVQDVDPMFMRNIVERAARFGGSYYENGIYNKGLLEPLVYDFAGRVTSYDGFWFAISAITAAVAALIGWAAARTARATGANRSVALAVAAVVYVHLTLSDADYARVLYSRNLTVGVLSAVWLTMLSRWPWSTPGRARAGAIAIGAALGFAVHSLTTTVFAGVAVGLAALATMRERRPAGEVPRLWRDAVASASVAFLAPIAYYVLRGSFAEFWAGWFTHARYMSVGTGRSVPEQFGLGWDELYAYYQARPLAFGVVAALAAYTWVAWHALDRTARIVHLGVLGWFAGAWIELVLSQRYSSHYFSVSTVPTALAAALLAGHATAAVARRRPATRASLAVPLVATLLAIWLTGPSVFVESVRRTSRFTSVGASADERRRLEGGPERTARAVLDLVSGDRDALLAWTIDPTVYLRFRRVPATRFQWKSFLLGEIYLGRTSTDYVLSRTWDWFADDVAESDPVAFAETEPFESDTPFEDLVLEEFTPVFPGGAATVWLRDDVARQVLDPSARDRWLPPGELPRDSGWRTDGPTATYDEGDGTVERPDDLLTLTRDSCVRIEGTLDVPGGDDGSFPAAVFRFDDNTGDAERLLIGLDATEVGSGSAGLGPGGYERVATGLPRDEPVEFALVVGRRAAALVVDGQVRAALLLTESVTVSVEARRPELVLRDLRVGAPPGRSCET